MLFIFLGTVALAQVKDVSYQLEYNPQTCLFDCYLVINDGSAETIRDRAQFNAQITVVVPNGANMQIMETYMPLERNQNYDGELSTLWEISNYIEGPAAATKSSFFSVTPNLSPTSFYNDLKEGDRVRLFGMEITPLDNCADGVSLFNNGKHPYSGAAGMRGGDFSNGFTIGGVKQKYNGNKQTILPPSPIIEAIDISGSDKVEVRPVLKETASLCVENLTFAWYGPQGFISDSPYLPARTLSSYDKGNYKVVVTNSLGCSTEKSFTFFDEIGLGSEEITGLEDNNLNNISGTFESSVFPNPTTDLINLKVNAATGTTFTVSIQDLSGKIINNNILSTEMTSDIYEARIPLNLETGVYNLIINIDEQETKSHKILIVK